MLKMPKIINPDKETFVNDLMHGRKINVKNIHPSKKNVHDNVAKLIVDILYRGMLYESTKTPVTNFSYRCD